MRLQIQYFYVTCASDTRPNQAKLCQYTRMKRILSNMPIKVMTSIINIDLKLEDIIKNVLWWFFQYKSHFTHKSGSVEKIRNSLLFA